ncbi:MAG: E3 binding domain-containing protein, partial [Chloroflexi bacterium]|nr:E3 binding domain-containing protein [Chloroflexota bacterium]
MSTNVTLPSMGFDMTEGKVSRWLKNIGDKVTRGETIGEIETEKATVDLAAPVDGIFAQILVEPGNTVAVNTPIAVIAAPGESVGAPTTAPTLAERQKEAAPATATQTPTQETAAPAAAIQAAPQENGRIKASPIARNMAKAEGIDLAMLKGTGPGGCIVERDVQKAIEAKKAVPSVPSALSYKPAPAVAPSAVPAPAPVSPRPVGEGQGISIPAPVSPRPVGEGQGVSIPAPVSPRPVGEGQGISIPAPVSPRPVGEG